MDKGQILSWLGLVLSTNESTNPDSKMEIRALKSGSKPLSKLVSNEEEALKYIESIPAEYNIYSTLNPIRTDAGDMVTDKDVVGRNWLMIDLDPPRDAGTSSSDDQLAEAKFEQLRLTKTIKAKTGATPIVGMSGNGYHMVYRLEGCPAESKFSQPMIRDLLKLLRKTCPMVDLSVHNPARIWKVYGTVSKKGEEHRLSSYSGAEDNIPLKWSSVVEMLEEKQEAPEFEDVANKKPLERKIETNADHQVWKRFKGDITTIDHVALMHELGWALSPQPNGLPAGAVACLSPMSSKYTTPPQPRDFIVYGPGNGGSWLFDFHSNGFKTAEEMFEYIANNHGTEIVDKHCSKKFEPKSPRELKRELEKAKEEENARPIPEFTSLGSFLDIKWKKREYIVDELILQGEVCMIAGPSKMGKSWMLSQLGLSVAAGIPFLGRNTTKGRVLYCNPEILADKFVQRITDQCVGLEVNPVEVAPNMDVWQLRGYCRGIEHLIAALIERVKKTNYKVIILDSIYKLLGDRDENSNGDIAELLCILEEVAEESDACVVYSHHFAKGDASKKQASDRASGAGSWMRSPDVAIMISPHEMGEGYAAVECKLRHNAAPNPFTVFRQNFVWNHRTDVVTNVALGINKQYDPNQTLAILGEFGGIVTKVAWKRAAMARVGYCEATFNQHLETLLGLRRIETQDNRRFRPANSNYDWDDVSHVAAGDVGSNETTKGGEIPTEKCPF